MPYIVTTKRQKHDPLYEHADWAEVSRRAVATLDEAQNYVHQQGATFTAAVITESGGTVGPLPDGTVIEVKYEP